MTDELRPVITPPPPAFTLPPRLHFLTRIVRAGAGLACFAGIVLSAYYFAGFAENDQGVMHLLFAAGISFGTGALLYVPAFITARKAHHVLRLGPQKGVSILTMALMLPWLFMGVYFLALGGYWAALGGVMLCLALICIYWAFTITKALKTPL